MHRTTQVEHLVFLRMTVSFLQALIKRAKSWIAKKTVQFCIASVLASDLWGGNGNTIKEAAENSRKNTNKPQSFVFPCGVFACFMSSTSCMLISCYTHCNEPAILDFSLFFDAQCAWSSLAMLSNRGKQQLATKQQPNVTHRQFTIHRWILPPNSKHQPQSTKTPPQSLKEEDEEAIPTTPHPIPLLDAIFCFLCHPH